MTTPLTDVKGIGGATAAKLAETGIDSTEALAAAAIEEIAPVPVSDRPAPPPFVRPPSPCSSPRGSPQGRRDPRSLNRRPGSRPERRRK